MTPTLVILMATLIGQPNPVHELWAWVHSPAAETASADTLRRVKAVLDESAIDLAERPSAAPGDLEVGNSDWRNVGAGPLALEVQAAYFSGFYDVLACYGANRSGKTVTVVRLSMAKDIRDHLPDGSIVWCIGRTAEKSRENIQRTLWEALPHWMFDRPWRPRIGFGHISTLQLTLPNGRGQLEVWFKYEDQPDETFESSAVDRVWWSECRRSKVLDLLIPRLLDRNGKLLMDYVPQYAWHKRRVKNSRNARWAAFNFAMADNAHNLPPGAIARAIADFGGPDTPAAQVRVFGKETADFGAVYKQFDSDRHVIKDPAVAARVVERAQRDGWPMGLGLDYGYAHPTAAVFAAMSPQEVLYVVDEHYQREWTVAQNAEAIEAKVKKWGGWDRFGLTGCSALYDPSMDRRDQRDGTSITDAYEAQGVPMTPGQRPNTVGELAMVERVRDWFLRDKVRVLAACENFVADHETWQYKTDKDDEVRPREPFEDKNNDCCDAFKLMVAEEPSYATVRRRGTQRAIQDADAYEPDGRGWPMTDDTL